MLTAIHKRPSKYPMVDAFHTPFHEDPIISTMNFL